MTLAIIFDSVGAGEWVILLAVLLVVMGPKRLPSTARKIGSWYSKFRRAADSFKRQLMDMDLEMERELQKTAQGVTSEFDEVKSEFAEEKADTAVEETPSPTEVASSPAEEVPSPVTDEARLSEIKIVVEREGKA